MITILNGKLTIPEEERFIGFAGDNLARKIEFILCGITQADAVYRLYLTFDDGTVNYFSLPFEVEDEGVVLTWNVEKKHIFKSGNVRAQIKAFSNRGVAYHTSSDTFFVGDSAEFADSITESNTEFLEYEEKLNSLMQSINEVCVLMPYVGDNGNWYIYDSATGMYTDSGKPSVGRADSQEIADGAVTSEKLARGVIDTEELFSYNMRNRYLSLPVFVKNIAGALPENYYNTLTEQGIYKIDSYSGVHEVLLVFKPDTQAYLMQILLKYNKIYYRGILCNMDGVYADEDWGPWYDLTDRGMEKATSFDYVTAVGDNVDPQILAYQTDVLSGQDMVRIPLSVISEKLGKIEDTGNYFVSETIEGALQELGAEVVGVSQLLSGI